MDLYLEKDSNEYNYGYIDKIAWWHSQFKGCLDVYPKVRSIVRRFDEFQQKVNLKLFTTLSRPTQELLAKVEQDLRALLKLESHEPVFPDDLRCWYLMCTSSEPLMGTYSFYHHEVCLSIVPLAFLAAAKRRQLYYLYLVPFCISPGETKMIYYVAKNFATYKRGNILCADASTNFFLLATSFTAWLNGYVTNCERGYYAIIDGAVNLFPRINVPVATTEGVTIQASPLFIPESSENGRTNFWAYSITITMASDVPADRSCKLVSRYWEITANGATQVTEGPGVIGLYPDVSPGSFFRYESCCPLKAATGSMGGYFVFRRPDGTVFRAVVPTMQFSVPDPLSEPDEFC